MERGLRGNPSDAELAILKELWADGPLTARSIAERLYPMGTPSDIATVQKLLQRLEQKGLVTRERKPPAHLFRAQVTQEQLVGEQLDAMAEKLTGGSLAPFVTHLIKAKRLTEHDLHEIRRLIRENS
jgi:BlaI family transcriptional regulator, penicillinase repressor